MPDLLPPMDFASLRQQAISLLEQMNGGKWTDFNLHDPGITILEVLCYVLTDLGYRANYSIPELIASAGSGSYQSLYSAPNILTCHPVTLTDIRKIVVDVEGVKNAWIEPLRSAADFYYHSGKHEIRLTPDPPATLPVILKGVYQVLIETSDLAGIDGSIVRRNVALRLHQNRGLCEDFVDIKVLEPQFIQVQIAIEIGPVEDAVDLMARVFEAIEDEFSPVIRLAGSRELQQAGWAMEDIFDGPRLHRGFITPDAFQSAERRTTVNSADLIRAIMDVPGVRAVRSINLTSGGKGDAWSLPVDPQKVQRLDAVGSTFILEREGIIAAVDFSRARVVYEERLSGKNASPILAENDKSFAAPAGRDRAIAKYYSLLQHLPPAYGVGEAGLSESASDERKARARQLKGYLLLFDQLLANEFAQLAHAADLFSFEVDDTRTYRSQVVDDPTLRLEDVRISDLAAHRARVDAITEDPANALLRKGRFLNHLLARFSEQLTDYSLVLPQALPPAEKSAAAKLVRDKQAFLRNYPHISSARGSAINYLEPLAEKNRSGLQERISLLLGLVQEEEFLLIEHLLLRPMEGDESQMLPLLAASPLKDPFSLQLSFVFPAVTERVKSADTPFRRLVERTVCEETPAHLTSYVHWLDEAAFAKVRAAYMGWLEARRAYWSEKFDVKP
jgi:hypothetical protein